MISQGVYANENNQYGPVYEDRVTMLNYDSMNDDPEHYWVFKYRAAPFDFYYNTMTGAWKQVQYISTVEHVTNVVFDGWAKYGPWRPR